VLETERLRLRELATDDAEFIVALLNDPGFIRNVADRGVRTPAAARAYIRDGPVASYRRHGFGLYLVELKDSRTPIGVCGLIRRDALDAADLGYALLPAFRSVGHAHEAAAAVMAFARSRGMTRVVAIVSPRNLESIRLLGKLGFRRERRILLADDTAELDLYASEP
jgi:RimJ/RimL family protein N-acetyltransferase